MSQHSGAGLLYCLRPGQGSLVAPAQPHGQRRWWDGILTTSRLHPSQRCPLRLLAQVVHVSVSRQSGWSPPSPQLCR